MIGILAYGDSSVSLAFRTVVPVSSRNELSEKEILSLSFN